MSNQIDFIEKEVENMNNNNPNQTLSQNLGITKEYDRKLYDSAKNKANFKEKTFDGKQTYSDPITGQTLHKSQNAAQNKYHKNTNNKNDSQKWAKHSAEVDHINSLKNVHDKVKHDPFLTDDDFKDIMNADENFRVTSKSLNASKGEKSDWDLILDKDSDISLDGKMKLAKEKIASDITITQKVALKTAKNAGNEFINGATDTLVDSTIPLTAEAVRKLIDIVQGKESLEDATKDMTKLTVDIAVIGGTRKILTDVVSSQLTNSNSVALQSISNSNQASQIIAVALIVKDSALKYLNGEIDGEEFIEEVGTKGASMVAGMIGGQIGKEIGTLIGGTFGTLVAPGIGTVAGMKTGEIIGKVLGTIITTVACSAIATVVSTTKHLNDYKLKESQVRKLEREALNEMENQRKKFREIVQNEFKIWDETVQAGFDQILNSACEENYDIQGVSAGLDKILSVFGKTVKFKTLDEYEEQLDTTLKLTF